MTELTMPQLSEDMTEGLVASWLVTDGTAVGVGDEILDVETDKSSIAVTAEAEGVLRILVQAGETVAVGEVLAQILPPGSEPSLKTPDVTGNAGSTGSAGSEKSRAERTRKSGETPPVGHHSAEEFPAGPPEGRPVRTVSPAVATPLAQRFAAVHGVDLADVTGTGPGGRIVRDDVARACGIDIEVSSAGPSPTRTTRAARREPGVVEGPGTSFRPLSSLQAVVARRMTEAKTTIPHFQVQSEAIVDELVTFRDQLRATGAAVVPSINDLIVRAVALTLREHPLVNGSYIGDGFQLHERVSVGVAVADGDALSVVTVRDADRLGLGALAAETRRLAEAVRERTILPDELSGATFTVSNLGMFGMTAIYPVINPPQAAILGVGASRRILVPADEGDGIERRLVMTLTLSCDHRILYGAQAAMFLRDVCRRIEQPMELVL